MLDPPIATVCRLDVCGRSRAIGLVFTTMIACARQNPAFDPKREAGEGADDDGDGTTLATSAADDEQATEALTTSPTITGDDMTSIDSGTSGEPDGCSVRPTPFDVQVSREFVGPVDLECGRINTFIGRVLAVFDSGWRMTMCTRMPGCGPCPIVEAPINLDLIDLVGMPPGLSDFDCIAVGIDVSPREAGCEVIALWIEPATGEADFPSYIATNVAKPSSFVLPEIALADAIEPCADIQCNGISGGHHRLAFGTDIPIAAGETIQLMLNPYGGVPAVYDVTASFAFVDQQCREHIGWTARYIDQ
jgi:hypothetical protein